MEFSLLWQSPYAHHNDKSYAGKIDFWRDFFPGNLQENLSMLNPGQKYLETFEAGILVPEYSDKNVIEFPRTLFAHNQDGLVITPEPGRFYPKSYAWKALHSFPHDTTPFRLVDIFDKTLVADSNHPLAKFPVEVEVSMVTHLNTATQRGGSCNDLAELLTKNGPGMQIPVEGWDKTPIKAYPFTRLNEQDDKAFYRSPRFVHHLDSTARSHVQSIYSKLLSPGMKVLDLMSSWESHMPDKLQDCGVTGVGLNEEELKGNEQLSSYLIHDLNKAPVLPFPGQQFDAAICTISIEYLIRPLEVMAELARVIRPGGIFIAIVSERWFPGKQILPWASLHPFERQGHVLNYFLHEKRFTELRTESFRGYPRPAQDKYSEQLPFSDSLFIISGKRT